MKASTKIEFSEFLSLMFRLTYRRPAVILLTCLALLNILFGLVYYAGIQVSDGPPTSNFLIVIILLGIFPLSAYISANRAYKSSARLQETIEFEILPDKFRQRGESFQTEFDLNKSY